MEEQTLTATSLDLKSTIADILKAIDKEREREIISRRFGLEGRRETLEEIGNFLGITRERVRQIEKHVVTRLRELEHQGLTKAEEALHDLLANMGHVARIEDIAKELNLDHPQAHSQINFVASLLPSLIVINDNDHFHHTIARTEKHDEKQLQQLHSKVVDTVKDIGKPSKISNIAKRVEDDLETEHVAGIARASKHLTSLEGKWGLTSWPLVNPKSIRDKIYVILQRAGKPMHFTEIADDIKASEFKRRDVTTQAIHNELIKDNRFVLVGRGIYALSEWGYSEGTVADIITSILTEESPLHRDEIVRRVLKQRHVKPTTIILNLQGKDRFKRVAKATYALA